MTKRLSLILILLISIIAGCTQPGTKMKKDAIVVGLESDIMGFAPWLDTWEVTTSGINLNIFNTLVALDIAESKIRPALAASWENPRPDVWKFHLKKGVKFHNGSSFSADDVKFSLEYIMQNEHGYKDLLASIKEVRVLDKYTVEFVTKEPHPSLLINLVEIFIVSKEYVERVEAEKIKNPIPVGTGAYRVKELISGKQFVLERFDDYWGKDPDIKTAVFKIINDTDKRLSALISGDIDITLQIPVEEYVELEKNDQLELYFATPNKVTYLAVDFRERDSAGFKGLRNPTANLKVRQAMYHAIDVHEIIEHVMHGLAESASQFVTDNIFGFNPEIKRLAYNPARARDLLQEAGYLHGFEIELDCPVDLDVNYPSICKNVVKQLAAINIDVKLNLLTKKEFFPKINAHQTSFYLLGWVQDIGDAQQIFDYLLYTVDADKKNGLYNAGMYSNPQVDNLGKSSAKMMSPQKRLRAMQAAFRIAADEVAWIPLVTPKILAASSKNLKWNMSSQGWIKIEDIRYKK